MGAVHKARTMMREQGARAAADYLRGKGYSLSAALHILLGTDERYTAK